MESIKIQYGKIEITPEEVLYDSSRIEILNRHMQNMIDDERLIGAEYCIIKQGKVIACNALGKFSYREEDTRTLQPDTVFRTASMTKLLTATAVFQLVEDGLVRLDEPMSRYITEMGTAEMKDIRIADVLSHTSGMYPDGGCFPDQLQNPWEMIDQLEPGREDDWLREAVKIGVKCRPGEQWMYCSFGYVLLGVLIERVTGIFADEYITQRILQPLGMKDSTFAIGTRRDLAERHIIFDDDTEKQINAILNGTMKQDRGVWNKIPNTAGGLHSTVGDMARFGAALCGGGRYGDIRILGKMAVERMTQMYLHNVPDYCWGSNNPNREYALGPDKRRGIAVTASDRFFFHEGWGYACVAAEPREELAACWYVPYRDGSKWYPESLMNVKNIILSGCM